MNSGVHVLCEAPVVLDIEQFDRLIEMAKEKSVVLMDSLKTAYAMAYNRLLLQIKSGKIGRVLSVDATCTSLHEKQEKGYRAYMPWNSMCAWGPTALLPVFQILGVNYKKADIISMTDENTETPFDLFTKIDLTYDRAVASIKVGKGVKSEGELIVSGTDGYIYVPSPWWKTDYFEIRYEDIEKNQRFFYQLDGEGIRYELVAFVNAINKGVSLDYIQDEITRATLGIIQKFYHREYISI